MTGTHAQVSHLGGSRVNLDEVGVAGFCLQHEVEPVKPGKIEPANHPLNRS